MSCRNGKGYHPTTCPYRCWGSVWLFSAGKDICLAQGGEKSTGSNFITEQWVESNCTSGMELFFFSASFVYVYFIKKLLHKYFGYRNLLLLLLGVELSLTLTQDVKQNLEKFTIKFVHEDMKGESLVACRPLKWSRMKKKLTSPSHLMRNPIN